MNMFCYQCQETAGNTGCTKSGVCGKKPQTSALQDLLIFVSKGVSIPGSRAVEMNIRLASDTVFRSSTPGRAKVM